MPQVINPFQGFSVITVVVSAGEKLSPGPLIRVCDVSIEVPFHSGSNDTIGSHVHLAAVDITFLVGRSVGGLEGLI